MVVVQQLDALGLAGLGNLLKQLDVALELGGAGAVLLHQVGDGDVLHANLHILLDGALHVRHQLLERHVGGKGHQAGVLNGGLDGGGLQTIKAGQLHTVVADFFNFFMVPAKSFSASSRTE